MKTIDEKTLTFNDPPIFTWILVEDAVNLLWENNPKLHSLGQVIASIERYGFQEHPKYDKNLINIKGKPGAIKAGNGRIEALSLMEQQDYDLPRGLATNKAGKWALIISFGVDASSESEAMAYAIDSNNLTMYGGNFNDDDIAGMWDEDGYQEVLEAIRETPPVAFDDLDFFLDAVVEEEEHPDVTTGNNDINTNHLYKFVVYELDESAAKGLKAELGMGEVESYVVKK